MQQIWTLFFFYWNYPSSLFSVLDRSLDIQKTPHDSNDEVRWRPRRRHIMSGADFFASILIKMHWFLFLVKSVFYHPILLQHLLICFPLFSCSRVQISCAKGIFPINTAKNVCKHKAKKLHRFWPINADVRIFLLIANNFAPNFCRPEKGTNNPLDWEFLLFFGPRENLHKILKICSKEFWFVVSP